MKTQEEIEQLASEHILSENGQIGFVLGYIQSKKDMANKKYTEQDIINAIQYGIDIESGNIKFDYKKYPDSFTQYLHSLNKQD